MTFAEVWNKMPSRIDKFTWYEPNDTSNTEFHPNFDWLYRFLEDFGDATVEEYEESEDYEGATEFTVCFGEENW